MRLLAIDAGNSRIKWGLHENELWLERGAVATAEAHRLIEVFSRIPPPARVVAANVAGDQIAQRVAAAIGHFGVAPYWVVSREAQCGVRSSYLEPERLGPDRWAALIGARHLHAGAAVVVNAGTTMTVDALSSEGIFLGGYIVPGYTLMRDSLATNTALLKPESGSLSFFPDNTADAIASGALNALAGAVDRMARYMMETGEGDAMILLSGGDAGVLAPMLTAPRLVDNLVLDGLLQIGVSDV